MQEEFYPAAEKILHDLFNLFTKDPKLKSFEIIPVVQTENKSPIHYEEHCLGLESWCVRHICCYAYNNLTNLRLIQSRDFEKLNMMLFGALLLNPDVTTFWNMRKKLIKKGYQDPYFDLHFTSVILTFKPKCADVFSFRKFILKHLLNDSSNNTTLFENELLICEAAADRYSNNYHAWTHRIWCLGQSIPKIFQVEWNASLQWVQKHVSDYSGYHYRQKLISFLLNYIQSMSYDSEVISQVILSVDDATKSFLLNVNLTTESIPLALKILIYELSLDSDLISNFVGHEALWCHRRFIFHEIKQRLDLKFSESWGRVLSINPDGIPPEKTQKIRMDSRVYLDDEFSSALSIYEEIFLNRCCNEQEPRQIYYADRHKQWLAKLSKFRLPSNEIEDSPIFPR